MFVKPSGGALATSRPPFCDTIARRIGVLHCRTKGMSRLKPASRLPSSTFVSGGVLKPQRPLMEAVTGTASAIRSVAPPSVAVMIGRAAGRARVLKYGYNQGVDVSLKKKTKRKQT